MRYDSESELPDVVRNQLPPAAQAIFRSAFNNAWDGYTEPDDPDTVHAGRDDSAHQAGWLAVRQLYERGDNDEWRPRACA